jgi:hypothetical protein
MILPTMLGSSPRRRNRADTSVCESKQWGKPRFEAPCKAGCAVKTEYSQVGGESLVPTLTVRAGLVSYYARDSCAYSTSLPAGYMNLTSGTITKDREV